MYTAFAKRYGQEMGGAKLKVGEAKEKVVKVGVAKQKVGFMMKVVWP